MIVQSNDQSNQPVDLDSPILSMLRVFAIGYEPVLVLLSKYLFTW